MPVLTMDFVPVPEPKTVKNRIHWDVTVPGVAALVQARATVLREPGGDVRWHVLADPEGNEFRAFTGRRASPCARHPGAAALASLPRIPASPLPRQQAQRPPSTWRY